MNEAGGASPHLWVIIALKRIFAQNNYLGGGGNFWEKPLQFTNPQEVVHKRKTQYKKISKKVVKKFGYIKSLPYLCLRKHKQRVSIKFFDNTEKAKIESSKSTLKVARQRARVLWLAVQV